MRARLKRLFTFRLGFDASIAASLSFFSIASLGSEKQNEIYFKKLVLNYTFICLICITRALSYAYMLENTLTQGLRIIISFHFV
jgi:hypothetical protein